MKTRYIGIDVLRGFALFMMVILHTAFYFYQGIYDIDLNNPSLIVTLIGFLLMFAGLFAMISTFSHTHQFMRKTTEDHVPVNIMRRYGIVAALFILITALLYFWLTGPGIIHFDQRMMDESLFVGLLNQNRLIRPSTERLFYIDSLVMIAYNLFLITLLNSILLRKKSIRKAPVYAFLAIVFLAVSYLRVPLYHLYETQGLLVKIPLHLFVAKNNPILPFFAFGLFGAYLAVSMNERGYFVTRNRTLVLAFILVSVGVIGYIFTPETMLERSIDPTWYFIMVTQVGVFLLMMCAVIRAYDIRRTHKKTSFMTRFFQRYGLVSLTIFFFESTVSALIYRLLPLPGLSMQGAILYGLSLAILYGGLIILWEKKGFRYGLEYGISQTLHTIAPSSKKAYLSGESS